MSHKTPSVINGERISQSAASAIIDSVRDELTDEEKAVAEKILKKIK